MLLGTEWPTLCLLFLFSLSHSDNCRFAGAVGPSDECTATTCRNGGVCVQHWHSWICDCQQTSFTGPTCNDGRQCSSLVFSFLCAYYFSISAFL